MKITYRPEIDGLRSISVFAVIFYHAKFILFDHSFFKGGFIGVDIFFVISGYLITTLILKEIYETNRFSFKNFYERRIRRILPVLLFIMIITLIVGYFFLLPNPYSDLAKASISSVFFLSNFYFFLTQGRYGAESELLKPLVHTWSLSIEEQFYILFPIFLIIINKFFNKKLFIILLLVFLGSLLFSISFSKISFLANFYLLPSRIFELLFGSLLSYLQLNNKMQDYKSYKILDRVCPSLGIILIFYSFIFFDLDKISHPGFITLIPLVGVALIIWFSKKNEFVTKMLSNKNFVFFGLISYSLYLWHYPIFAYLRYVEVFNNYVWIKLLAITSTIVLSILSYYFIEKPFRNKNIISIKTLFVSILICLTILLSSSFYTFITQGIKNRFPSIILDLNNIPNEFEIPRKILKIKNAFRGPEIGNTILIGDSHAFQLGDTLNKSLVKINYKLSILGFNSRFFYLQNFDKFFAGDLDTEHQVRVTEINNFLKDHSNEVVIFNYQWKYKLENYEKYFNLVNIENYSVDERNKYLLKKKKYLIENLKLTFNNILNQGNTIIFVYPPAEMDFDPPRLINKEILKEGFSNKFVKKNKKDNNKKIKIFSVSYDDFKKETQEVFKILDSIVGPKVYRVYPHKYLCNTFVINRCVANSTKHLFYSDYHHLTFQGRRYIVNDIMEIIQNIEVDKKTTNK